MFLMANNYNKFKVPPMCVKTLESCIAYNIMHISLRPLPSSEIGYYIVWLGSIGRDACYFANGQMG